jgi:polysaccharide biosynthesis protein PslH
MRLLFLTETIPYPLDSGGRIKSYHTLRMLSSAHEVHCHALVRDRALLGGKTALEAVACRVVLHPVPRTWPRELASAAVSQITRTPFLVRRHFHRAVLGQLRSASDRVRFDAVYCDHLSMLEYGRRLGLPIVLDAHNVEFEIIRRHAATLGRSPVRLLAEVEWRRLRRYEQRWYRECRLIFSVSDVDAARIRSLAGRGVPVTTVPIAVDAASLPPAAGSLEPRILFVGGLHWPPNADAVTYFARDVLPLVRAAVPDVTFTVVGRDPDTVARAIGDTRGIEFAGHVADLAPYYDRCRAMVVPIRSGSGMRVKILDALARGVPTISTTIGAEGIAVRSGEHLLVADDQASFASAVVEVLSNEMLAASLGRAGRALVADCYDTPVIRSRVLDALQRTFGPPAALAQLEVPA